MAKKQTAENVPNAPPVVIPNRTSKRREANQLSPVAVNNLAEPGRYPDGAGLWLQVSPSGARSWLFIYRRGPRGASKQTWLGLGSLVTVSLKEAREKARILRQELQNLKEGTEGATEPLEKRRAARMAEAEAEQTRITFAVAAEKYIAAHRAGWKNAKHAAQWESTLDTYAGPVIGAMPVASIAMNHVLRVLEQPASPGKPESLWSAKPETASRLRGRVEKVLEWCEGRKYRTGPNPARWKGNLSVQLPARKKSRTVVHHAAVPVAEMSAFMAELRRREGISARALEFTCLTAARTGEVIGATWEEINLSERFWVVPAERMKMEKAHRVPLSGRALEILRALPHREGFVFPGARENQGLSNMAMAELMKTLRPGYTVHGTARSTFKDWAHEQTNFASEVIEMSLAHAIGSAVEKAYRRGELIAKRTKLMAAWEQFCNREFLNGSALFTVVPLHSKAKTA